MKKRKAAAKPAQQPLFAELEYPLETSIDEQLRQAMKDSNLSRYAIAQQSGINQSVLSRFASGERGLTAETAERLAHSLGLRLALVSPMQELFVELTEMFGKYPPREDVRSAVKAILRNLQKESLLPPYVSLLDFRKRLASRLAEAAGKPLRLDRDFLDRELLAMRKDGLLSFSVVEGRHAMTADEREACLMIGGQPYLLVQLLES